MQDRDTSSLILNAAEQVLWRHGYQRSTLDDIAAQAGLTKGAIYHYFEGKRALIQAVVKRFITRLNLAVEQAVASRKGPEEKLLALMREHAKVIVELERRLGFDIVRLTDLEPMFSELGPLFTGPQLSLIQQIIEEGIERGVFEHADPAEAARVVFAALQGVNMVTTHGMVRRSRKLHDSAQQLILRALRAPRAQPGS